MTNQQAIAKLRKVCLALPNATETEAWGHPTFRIRNKIFCVYGGYDDSPNITLKVGKPALGIFLEDPRYWKASHIGNQGWISMNAKADLDWEELTQLIKGSYGLVAAKAPKKPAKPRAKKPAIKKSAVKPVSTKRAKRSKEK